LAVAFFGAPFAFAFTFASAIFFPPVWYQRTAVWS
jgi:hypothetical protein